MTATTVHVLLASLLTVAIAGCREEPHPHDLSRPPVDMIITGDMTGDMANSSTDLSGPPRDMSTRPGDMAMSGDMNGPAGDMAGPAGDMTPVGDMRPPPADLAGADMTPSGDPSEFIVLIVGDGTAGLTSAATAAFLERHKVNDGTLVGVPIALPTAVSGTNRRLTIAGTSASEGSLSRSVNGKYVLFGGYDAAAGTANVAGTMGLATSRVLGRLDSAGVVDTSTAGDFFSMTSLRSVVSTDGSPLWASGSAGLVYTTFGSTTTPTALLALNARWIQILSGQLYVSSGSAANHGISQIGTGTPTTATTATLLNGFAAQPMTSYYGFIGLDRDATPGIDVIYAADDRPMGGGIQRWTLSGTTWKLDGTIAKGLTAGTRALTGFISGGKVVLLATTAELPTRVVSFIDDGTALDMLASKQLATAATNTAHRGIALAPQ